MTGHLTVTETAERLGVSRQAVLKRIQSGALPAVRQVARNRVVKLMVPVEAVDADVRRRNTEPRPTPGHLTVIEAAKLIGRTPPVIRTYIADGLLRATWQGGQWWVTSTDVVLFNPPRRGPQPRKDKP